MCEINQHHNHADQDHRGLFSRKIWVAIAAIGTFGLVFLLSPI